MKKALLLAVLLLFGSSAAQAASYPLPSNQRDQVIGEPQYATAGPEDTLIDIARRYDVGYDEIVKANSGVNRWLPGAGTRVLIPTQHILPDAPREGIVLNLAELRLYYFPPAKDGGLRRVHTYPVSVGRMDWKSPLGETKVTSKEKDPSWTPTESIRAEHAAEGEVLPKTIPGGDPENPLGHYALRLARAGYLIHGTDEKKSNGIGMRVTHGCVRMYPEDIEELYGMVSVNTPVRFVDQPVKAGWLGPDLVLEVHSPLEEDEVAFYEYSHRLGADEVSSLVERVAPSIQIDPAKVEQVAAEGKGIPEVIGTTAGGLPPAAQPERTGLLIH